MTSFRKENFINFLRIFSHPICQICSERLNLSEKFICGPCFMDLFEELDLEQTRFIFEKSSKKATHFLKKFSNNVVSYKAIEAMFLVFLSLIDLKEITIVYEDETFDKFQVLKTVFELKRFSIKLDLFDRNVIFIGLKPNPSLFLSQRLSLCFVKSFKEIYLFS